jgi:hypothetical protein
MIDNGFPCTVTISSKIKPSDFPDAVAPFMTNDWTFCTMHSVNYEYIVGCKVPADAVFAKMFLTL